MEAWKGLTLQLDREMTDGVGARGTVVRSPPVQGSLKRGNQTKGSGVSFNSQEFFPDAISRLFPDKQK